MKKKKKCYAIFDFFIYPLVSANILWQSAGSSQFLFKCYKLCCHIV